VDVVGPTRLPDPADDTKSIVLFTVEIRMRGTTPA
jgi:hypothetical protein